FDSLMLLCDLPFQEQHLVRRTALRCARVTHLRRGLRKGRGHAGREYDRHDCNVHCSSSSFAHSSLLVFEFFSLVLERKRQTRYKILCSPSDVKPRSHQCYFSVKGLWASVPPRVIISRLWESKREFCSRCSVGTSATEPPRRPRYGIFRKAAGRKRLRRDCRC